jgi:hypothetical protein
MGGGGLDGDAISMAEPEVMMRDTLRCIKPPPLLLSLLFT